MFDFFSKTTPSLIEDIAAQVLAVGVGFIDVRTSDEYSEGHARGAANVPLDVVGEHATELREYAQVYVICQSGARSARAVRILSALGVSAINVSGGTTAWKSAGLPIE